MPAQPAAAQRLDSLARTREAIVLAARDLVAEEGWPGAQIALIAARAGVATGSVYRYFESKAALYAQVMALVSQGEVEVLRSIMDDEGSATERLAGAVRAFVKRAMKSPRLAYALIAEPCDPEIDATRLHYRGAIAREFARVVRDGIASGEFVEVDESVAASCLAGAFMEALVGPLVPGTKAGTKAAERVAEAVVEMCIRMVAKPASAARAVVRKIR